jgi:hypothetical protein
MLYMAMKVGEKMLFGSQQTRHLLALSLSLCLALASIGPSVAVACEGASLEPVTSSGKGPCPEEAKRVLFTTVKEWCEYVLKNNTAEEVKVERHEFVVGKECEREGGLFRCIEFETPAEGHVECRAGVKLKANGGTCYSRVEYKFKTMAPKGENVGFYFETKTEISGVKEEPFASIRVK